MTSTRQRARPQKPELQSTAAPKLTARKSKKGFAVCVKSAATKPTTPNLVAPPKIPSIHWRKSQISFITFTSQHEWS